MPRLRICCLTSPAMMGFLGIWNWFQVGVLGFVMGSKITERPWPLLGDGAISPAIHSCHSLLLKNLGRNESLNTFQSSVMRWQESCGLKFLKE